MPGISVSRVKRIIAQDPEIQICSNNAAFVVTLATVRILPSLTSPCFASRAGGLALQMPLATWSYIMSDARVSQEMFIQHLAIEAQGMAKLDRKPRRNVQYKDLGEMSPRLSLYPPSWPAGLGPSANSN